MLTQRLRQTWLQAMLTVALLALTLSLAGAGIYGVLNYSVQIRRYELGIHLSLGAHTHKLIAQVLKQSLTPVMIGLGVSALTVAIGYGILTKISTTAISVSWFAVIVTIPIMLLIALIASYLPVQRVISQDPIKALRDE